ncbi:MAG: winged helix-turn-helix domain-containing protein [Bryobacteraceae bacterium]
MSIRPREVDHQRTQTVEFGPFALDLGTGELTKHGTSVRLRGMPLKILHYLVERPGEVVTRSELQRLLWPETAYGDFEQGLNTAVNVVRRTLADSADQPRYIETIPGAGYRFIAPVNRQQTVASDTQAELHDAQAPRNPAATKSGGRSFRGWFAAMIAAVLLGGAAWRWFQPARPVLISGAIPSANQTANDQYNLGMNFLAFQNDSVRAGKAFERALQIDPDFAAARLQRACLVIIDIFNGYSNDETVLLQAEQDLHRAAAKTPAGDGLLLSTQAAVYFVQGRLDQVPRAGLDDWWRRTGGKVGSPVWVVLFPMLAGQTDGPLQILRGHLERNPQEGPARMFLGELQRTMGDTEAAVRTLELTLEQGPNHPTTIFLLAMAYLDQGLPAKAHALLQRTRADLHENYMWRHASATVLAALGEHEKARVTMDDETLKYARLAWTVTSATADFYALQNDRARAIEWLRLAAARGDERTAYFRRNPRLAVLRGDERFASLLASIETRRR